METKQRCAWCEKDDLYRNYHDNEWGKPVYDDATIFTIFAYHDSGFSQKRKLQKSI